MPRYVDPVRVRLRLGGGFSIAFVVGVLLACGSIEEDELLCEEAASHLDECCAEIDVHKINCRDSTSCSNTLVPVIDDAAGKCIRNRSCDDLKAKGSCAVFDRLATDPSAPTTAYRQEACK